MSNDPTQKGVLEAVEQANDKLAEAMENAQTYASHQKVRPSAMRALDAAEEAHQLLTEVDPTRNPNE